MKIAAWQAPLLPAGSMAAVALIGQLVRQCEADSIDLLCCPEAILGGLADDATNPQDFAIRADIGQLTGLLEPLASNSVTTILGFTEATASGLLYNSAAILNKGEIIGIYRKRHPAIRSSIYQPGTESPIFTVNGIHLGVLICNDSNFPEHATELADQGAGLIVIPTNNALRPEMADVVDAARQVDIALTKTHRAPVIRADVAGKTADRLALGSSAMTAAQGVVRLAAPRLEETLLVQALSELQ